MARPRRQSPHLQVARAYIERHLPELCGAPLCVRLLDGPPDAPRYAITAERCTATICPHGPPSSAGGRCSVAACPLRVSARLLISRSGEVVQVTRSDLHWR